MGVVKNFPSALGAQLYLWPFNLQNIPMPMVKGDLNISQTDY